MPAILEWKKNPASLAILAACAAVFAAARLGSPESVRFLAFETNELPGRWYAFLTYGFTHVDWNHIILNMLVLAVFGAWVERLLGAARYLLLVAVAILAGSATLYARETAGIGFSAAAAALLFYYNVAFPLERELPFRLPNIALPVALFALSAAASIFGWLPSVGHVPHLAGAMVGLLFLALFRKRHRPI
ncbi:MAG: rhomboid family intramembrane serine protease [Spirochaetes bacterium]|nr:rhomboid family intramembrane serine protease [Spirochaetota bacterium]MBU1079195.1 rhomboid family intramembrane serine protease [Spirochaetota bacterium]